MSEDKQSLLDRALDELSHQNDKRVVVFVLGVGAIVWVGTRPVANMEVVQYVSALTALAILGISLRPEKSAFVTLPKPSNEAPEAPSAVSDPPK